MRIGATLQFKLTQCHKHREAINNSLPQQPIAQDQEVACAFPSILWRFQNPSKASKAATLTLARMLSTTAAGRMMPLRDISGNSSGQCQPAEQQSASCQADPVRSACRWGTVEMAGKIGSACSAYCHTHHPACQAVCWRILLPSGRWGGLSLRRHDGVHQLSLKAQVLVFHSCSQTGWWDTNRMVGH